MPCELIQPLNVSDKKPFNIWIRGVISNYSPSPIMQRACEGVEEIPIYQIVHRRWDITLDDRLWETGSWYIHMLTPLTPVLC